MQKSVKIQARLSEHNLILIWDDYRKEFMKQTGIYPTDSDVLGSILHKAKEVNYHYSKRLNFLKLKERSENEEKEFRLLVEIVDGIQEDERIIN